MPYHAPTPDLAGTGAAARGVRQGDAGVGGHAVDAKIGDRGYLGGQRERHLLSPPRSHAEDVEPRLLASQPALLDQGLTGRREGADGTG